MAFCQQKKSHQMVTNVLIIMQKLHFKNYTNKNGIQPS